MLARVEGAIVQTFWVPFEQTPSDHGPREDRSLTGSIECATMLRPRRRTTAATSSRPMA